MSEIFPIPPVPEEIINAVNENKLAVFIGAGVSHLIGCKGWDQLAKNLIERCYKLCNNEGRKCLNYKDRENLCNIYDNKKTITICKTILTQNGYGDIFLDELKESLCEDKKLIKSKNIYKELSGLNGIFITTNIDKHFDEFFNQTRIVYKLVDFDIKNIDRDKLYHIHGVLKNDTIDSLVLTVPDYINRYNKPEITKFLREIFHSYNVLFVGYGLSEFEIIDFIITKSISGKSIQRKHFILLACYKSDNIRLEEHYYNPMGIEVIGYEKDENGYDQLYEVIKDWRSKINQRTMYLYDSFKEIDEAIE